MRRLAFLVAAASLAMPLAAKDAGVATAPFLTMPGEAKGAAMGEAYSAEASGASALWYNPAGLTGKEQPTASLMHTLYIENVTFNTLAVALPFGTGHALAFGAEYLSVGSIESFDNAGQAAPSYAPKDLSVRLGYAERLQQTSLGVSFSYIRSTILDSATTKAFNAGLTQGIGPLSLAFSTENIGRGLTFQREQTPLPRRTRLGASLRVLPALHVTSDFVMPRQGAAWVAGGSEYVFDVAANKSVGLRAGYNTASGGISSGLHGISAGASFRFSKAELIYAWVPFGDLGQTHRFSLDFQLSGAENVHEPPDDLLSFMKREPRLKSVRLPDGDSPNGASIALSVTSLPSQPWKITHNIARSSREKIMGLLARDGLCLVHAPKAVVTKAQGSVRLKKADQVRWSGLREGQYLFEGDMLETKDDAYAQLLFSNNARLELSSQALMQVKALLPACDPTTIRLERGQATAMIDRNRSMLIETPYGEAQWSELTGQIEVNDRELVMRVTSDSATFRSDGENVPLRPGRVYRKAPDDRSLSSQSAPASDIPAKPAVPVTPSTTGRWDTAYVEKFDREIEKLESIPDVKLGEYVRDVGLRDALRGQLDELERHRGDLEIREQDFKQDVTQFLTIKNNLRSGAENESAEERKLRRLRLSEVNGSLKQAQSSLRDIQKELSATMKEFRANEEYLAAIPIVRMLNITAQESAIPFESGSSVLPDQSYGSLEGIAAAIKELQPYRVVVEGHTDKVGSRRVNERLSKTRADAVVNYLRLKTALPPRRFLSKGMGADHPLVDGESSGDMSKNRRVEIWFELRGL